MSTHARHRLAWALLLASELVGFYLLLPLLFSPAK